MVSNLSSITSRRIVLPRQAQRPGLVTWTALLPRAASDRPAGHGRSFAIIARYEPARREVLAGIGEDQRVLDPDAEVAHGALDPGAPERGPHRSQIARRRKQARRFRPTQRARDVIPAPPADPPRPPDAPLRQRRLGRFRPAAAPPSRPPSRQRLRSEGGARSARHPPCKPSNTGRGENRVTACAPWRSAGASSWPSPPSRGRRCGWHEAPVHAVRS